MKLLFLTSVVLLGVASATLLHDKKPHIRKTYKWVKVPKLEIVKPDFGIKEKVIAGKEKTWALLSSLVSNKVHVAQPVFHEKKTVVYPAWKIHKYKGIEIRPVRIVHSKSQVSAPVPQPPHKVVVHAPQWNTVYAPHHQVSSQVHHIPSSSYGVPHPQNPIFTHPVVVHDEVRVPSSEYGVPQIHTPQVPSSHHGVSHVENPIFSDPVIVHDDVRVPSSEYGVPQHHTPQIPSSHHGVSHVQNPIFSHPVIVHDDLRVPSSEYGVPQHHIPQVPSSHHGVSHVQNPIFSHPAIVHDEIRVPSSEYGVPQNQAPQVPSSHYGVPHAPNHEVTIPHKVHSEIPSTEYGVPQVPSLDYGLPHTQGPQFSNSYQVVHNEPAKGPQQVYGVPAQTAPASSYQIVNHGVPAPFQAPHYTVYAPHYDARSDSDVIPQYEAEQGGKTSQWAPIFVPDQSPINAAVPDNLHSLPEVSEVSTPELPPVQSAYPLHPASTTNFNSFNYETYPPYNHQTLRNSYGDALPEAAYSPSENLEVVVPAPDQQTQSDLRNASDAVLEEEIKSEGKQVAQQSQAEISADISKEESQS